MAAKVAPPIDEDVDEVIEALDPKAAKRNKKGKPKKEKVRKEKKSNKGEGEEASQAQPKANKKAKNGKNPKKGKGGLVAAILIPTLLAGSLIGVLAFNPLNLRDGALAPVLLNIPVLGDFVQTPELNGQLGEATPAQLNAQVAALEAEVRVLLAETDRLEGLNMVYANQVAQLLGDAQSVEALEADRAAFENMVAEANITGFIQFYEQFDPERAAEIFERLAGVNMQTQAFRDYFNTITAMEAGPAANMLEEMIPTDMPIVVEILRALDNEFSGEVLSGMSSENASIVVRQMFPGEMSVAGQ